MFRQMKISTKLSILTGFMIAATVVGTSTVCLMIMHRDLSQQAVTVQESRMKTFWELVGQKGKEFRRDGERLLLGEYVVNGNYELPDRLKQLCGGTATIFMGDTRVSTNVLKPDGSRAVGTKLQGPAFDAIFKHGQPYRGETKILGVPFFTAYDPIKNAAGETIGVLYVGVKKAEYFASYNRLVWTICILALFLLPMACAVSVKIVHIVLKQLGGDPREVAEVAMQVASGDFSRKVPVKAGDTTSVMAAMQRMSEAVSALVRDVSAQTGAIAAGRLEQQADTGRHQGEFRTILEEVNACAGPVKQLADDVTALTCSAVAGQLSTRADASGHQGDFRKIVDGLNATMDAVVTPINEVQQVLGYMANGNLGRRMESDVRGDFKVLKDSLNNALAQLSSAIGAVTINARQVASATAQTSGAIGQIAEGSQNQLHAISQVASSIKQTAASIVDVSRNTEEASHKARESLAIVNDGQAKMQQMVQVVNNIAANSEKINKITDVIEKIANKTNLLSLNAAIEAARAGEHGRGFAVVAEEVGKLAANAADSTQEIMALVGQAVKEANQAVATVNNVSAGMQQIADGALQTDAMLQRISAALEQQSAAVQEVNANVAGLSKVAESNATAAEEITATVFELAKIADNTRQEAERFRV